MKNIPENIKKELDSLIKISKDFRDNTISGSMFFDVVHSFRTDDSEYDIYMDYMRVHNITIVDDRDEVENFDDNEPNDFIKPYDPSNIDISLKTLSLQSIIDRLETDEIELMPDFQRKAGLWTDIQKSQLIESLLLRIPLPAFYFDGSFNDRWIVIDGLQRLTTIKQFFVEKTLSLSGLEFMKDLDGTNIYDMPRAYLRRMRETQITTYIINPGAPMNLKYNIFKRINTGGLSLEPQEIRHALYQGIATKLLKNLAEMDIFKQATGYGISEDRMLDREFVLRFIAFYEFGPSKYRGSIEPFLNDTMEYMNKNYTDESVQEIRRKFLLALNISLELFGKFSFRKMPDLIKRRRISKALFETWTSTLARLSYENQELLLKNRDTLLNYYMLLFQVDEDFNGALNSGKYSSVKLRFDKIEELIKKVIMK